MREDSDPVREPADGEEDLAALEGALADTPKGAIVLAGSAVVLMMACWFAIYFLIFLPRGSVG